jgi:excisionase family DNA binding protein
MEQIVHTDPSATPLLLTIPEAARLLAVGRSTLYELINEGRLRPAHICRSVRIPVEELREFVTAMREG